MIAPRLLLSALGGAAVVWGAMTIGMFWRDATPERIADGILGGQPFRTELLAAQLPGVAPVEQKPVCRHLAPRSAAVIRLRVVEEGVLSGERRLVDADMVSLRDEILRSLACLPADPFLWLALMWTENTQRGFSQERLKYLRMSYRLGPGEGWIAARRNRFAMSLFEQLPADLAEMAINEFVGLLDSGFYWVTLDIFTGPGWPIRDRILPRLSGVSEGYRTSFAKGLYARGYDVDVPGIDRPEPRPWH
jgi:hypothetical protein